VVLSSDLRKVATAKYDELVSIITPAYNAARFVDETARSVIAQTYPHWEMLIVDDCSKDDTRAHLERLAAQDPRIKPIFQEKNGGPARARNTALRAATGAFLAFLDADDLWLPEKLEKQIAFMRERNSAFSYTGFRRMTTHGEQVGELRPLTPQLRYQDLLKNTAIVTSTVLIDRRVTGDFEMPVTYYDDFATWLLILRRGHVAHGLAEDLLRYRIVGASVSRNKSKSAKMVWRTYRDIEKLSVPYSAWCFSHYAWRAFRKYRSL
jgi:teichuronic acid biosynthesis glycosyltransferase TuaG